MAEEGPGRPHAEETQAGSQGKAVLLFLWGVITGGIGGFLGDILSRLFLEEGAKHASAWPGIAGFLFFAIGVAATWHYWTVLGYGAFAKGSQQRARYNRLRTGLSRGGRIGQAYEGLLQETLDVVDRFFGDWNKADRTLFPKVFGLKKPAPLWTATSYDRCLLIALIYPATIIILDWAIFGHVGPAEAALRLPKDVSAWTRGLALAAVLLTVASWVKFMRAERPRQHALWCVVTSVCGCLVLSVGDADIATIAFALTLSVAFAFAVALVVKRDGVNAFDGAGAGSTAFVVTGAMTVAFAGATAGLGDRGVTIVLIIGFSFVVAFAIALLIADALARRLALGTMGRFLSFWTLFVLVLTLVSPSWIASFSSWQFAGPLLLFIVLLTLINAPFDWLTLGFTRALLRRGLELGGWWPLAFGLIDLLAAAAVVAGLAVVTLWAVQLFGHFTRLGSGALILDPFAVLDALADPNRRLEPEYWWLYAMLFSTLIPSIINVALGALSLMRGVPGTYQLLARRMPPRQAVLESERMWMAPLLSLQWGVSVLIGLATMLGLLWAILAWGLPLLGLNLIPLLQALARADLPLALLRLLGLG